MSTQHVPIGFVDEAGEPVLLPKPKAWLGTKDQAYSAALERARTYYASDLLYSADDFNALQAQRDELLVHLQKAISAQERATAGIARLDWLPGARSAIAKANGSAA